jgi:hypothetical protein
MRRLYIISWSVALIAAACFWYVRPPTTFRSAERAPVPKDWLQNEAKPLTPAEHIRTPDQTYLTYPEWFLVFGPAEYAESMRTRTASRFPLTTHIHQAWESYAAVSDQIAGTYPPNDEYNTMIKVINTSSTFEFGIKAAYEEVIGRITDVGAGTIATEEDRFAARFAQEYIDVIYYVPWYEFDFIKQTKTLWSEVPWFGAHPLRKLERRFFLTSELLTKAVYGWANKQAALFAYGKPLMVTYVVLDRAPSGKMEGVTIKQTYPDGSVLAEWPRYGPFTPLAIEAARQGVAFREIAGNRTATLISAVGPADWQPTGKAVSLFSQPIPTKPGQCRWAIATPVANLHTTLKRMADDGLTVEHVFDF